MTDYTDYTINLQDLRPPANDDALLRRILDSIPHDEHRAARVAWGEWSSARLGVGSHKEAFHSGWDAAFAFMRHTIESLAPVVGAEGGAGSPAASAEPGPTTEGATSARASIEESETRWREGEEEGVTERPLHPVGSGADVQAWATVLPAVIGVDGDDGYLVRLEQFTTCTLEEAQALGDALLERAAVHDRRIEVDGCSACPFLGYREELPDRAYYWCEQSDDLDVSEHAGPSGSSTPDGCPLREAPRLVQLAAHRRAP